MMRKKLLATLVLPLLLLFLLLLCAGCAGESPASHSPDDTFDVKTSLVTMKYPAKWQGIVTVETSDTAVKFSYGEYRLFDLLLGPGDGDGYLLGSYRGTPIRIVSYDVDRNALSDAEFLDYCAMQEDVNVILRYLREDPDFQSNR